MTDDELLDALSVAYLPEPADPPAATLVQVRQAFLATARPESAIETNRAPRYRWRRTVAATAGIAVLSGGAVAFAAANDALPRPLRTIARAVGLPIESPELADARRTAHELRDALARGDVAEAKEKSAHLESVIALLSPDERAHAAESIAALEDMQRVGPSGVVGPTVPPGVPDPNGAQHPVTAPSTSTTVSSHPDDDADGEEPSQREPDPSTPTTSSPPPDPDESPLPRPSTTVPMDDDATTTVPDDQPPPPDTDDQPPPPDTDDQPSSPETDDSSPSDPP